MPTQSYYVAGKRVPSVTTILGKFKDARPLMYWAANVAKEVLAEAVEKIDCIVNSSQRDLSQPEQINLAREFLKSKPQIRGDFEQVSEKACTAGTIAHEIVDQYIRSPNKSLQLEILQVHTSFHISAKWKVPIAVANCVENAIKAFVAWTNSHRFVLQQTEIPLVSSQHRFGGCVDCIATLDNLVIFDWKTSNAIYADNVCQIAAYRLLWNENNPKQRITSGHILRFDKEDANFTHHHFNNLDTAEELFLLFRRAYDLLATVGKSI